jgi:4-diphosphocytidyl-2-C-methyl-D-erythritol kinase
VFRRAYAKINLSLSVGPPLPEGDPSAGMHPIASWMHCIDLCDDIWIQPRPGEARGMSRRPVRESTVEADWAADAPVPSEIDWPAEKDLSLRAVRLLEEHAGEPLAVQIRIAKRIPLGGGLGGGSSDAAATLQMVNELFGLGLSTPALAGLAARLGSDVSFFLDETNPARPALVTGLGEAVERLPKHNAEVVLILPPFGCPTASIYRAFDDLAHSPRSPDLERVRGLMEHPDPGPHLFNDLTAAAHAVAPELARLHQRLREGLREPVHMTGSGSTLFVLSQDPVATAAAAERAAPEATVLRTRLV